MAKDFDPYHRWLGIPPKDQPPNYYRLLAIDLFEGDPEVIQDAAEQRIAHVRTYQLGPTSALSQRILNELAGAKACLLDSARKAEYDEQLRRQLARGEKPPVVPPPLEMSPTPPITRAVGGSLAPMRKLADAGRPLLMIGLLLVIVARGCEELGNHYVKRVKALEGLARSEFDDQWKEKRLKIEQGLEQVSQSSAAINAKSERTGEDRRRLEVLNKQEAALREELANAGKDEPKEKSRLEQGEWRDLQILARDAPGKNAAAAYWTYLAFVSGTIILSFGLLIVSSTAEGAERWVSLLMLAIIVCSIYVVSFVWTRAL